MSNAKRKTDDRWLIPWRRTEDPFKDAKPLDNMAVLIGGLPDERDPDEIIRDLRRIRAVGSGKRPRS